MGLRGALPGTQTKPPLTGNRLLASATYLRNPKAFADRITLEQSSDVLKLGMPSPEIVADPFAYAEWRHVTTHATWMKETDRTVVEVFCFLAGRLKCDLAHGERVDEKTVNAVMRLATLMGFTATSRARIVMHDQPAKGEKAKKGSKYSEWKP